MESDPYPDSAGVFLGSGVADDVCFNGSQTDNDQDGLSTFCETNLASAFAPELRYASFDDLSGEPHWVAQPFEDYKVRIGYLLSYYYDYGTTNPLCDNTIGDDLCAGHYGDSEWIFLDVYYNESTKHWLLETARYSQHTTLNTYSRGSHAYPTQLSYPSHPGTYPRSWVSHGKHANNATQSECDAGGAFGFDSCSSNNVSLRVPAGGNLNLGSSAVHTSAQDCMISSNPIYAQSGRSECYWTVRRFSGWTGNVPDSSPYRDKLSAMGF